MADCKYGGCHHNESYPACAGCDRETAADAGNTRRRATDRRDRSLLRVSWYLTLAYFAVSAYAVATLVAERDDCVQRGNGSEQLPLQPL